MKLDSLTAISPIDGRYRNKTAILADYFSEFALIKYRLQVEILYFLFLEKKNFFEIPNEKAEKLKKLYLEISIEDAKKIKSIESVTNHDVKAVEYFIKEKLDELQLSNLKEWVHFGLTSQDINNTAYPLMWKDSLANEYLPGLQTLLDQTILLAKKWSNITILAHTHGQPASPTKMGKELMVFVERIKGQETLLQQIPHTGKFGGATGNFNAHYIAYPAINWPQLADEFLLKNLGLVRQQYTTQIEHYDHLAAFFQNIGRINTILIDMCRDIWTYISLGYFHQKTKEGEVGSSTMPHKVNPIDFENAEGNFGLANALFSHFAEKLPVSRLQRDLTDSTVLRNIGVALAHTVLAFQSLEKGLKKLEINTEKINADLDANWVVIAEAIQTILRREQFPNAYEILKQLTRGHGKITKKDFESFINELDISENVKEEMRKITPQNYTGHTLI